MTTYARVGSLFLRTGNKVIAPPAPGGLVVLAGGPSQAGTYLVGSIPGLAGGGAGMKSVALIARIRVDELLTAFGPGGLGGAAIATVSDAFELAVSGSSGTFLLSSTIPTTSSIGSGPENGITPHAVSLLPLPNAATGFVWFYAFIDYTVGGAGNYTSGYYMFTDSGTQLAGANQVNTYGSGAPNTDPANLGFALGQFPNAPFDTIPGGIVADGVAIFGDPVVSAQLSGAARYTPPSSPTVPRLLVSYGFSGVFTPDQVGLSAPLVPTSIVTPSATFIPGGIFN